MHDSAPQHARHRVLVAGGGVAGLEAILALSKLAGELVEITLVAPEAEFRYRQLSVAAPFEWMEPPAYGLADISAELGVRHLQDVLSRVDAESRLAHTANHGDLPYDSLLIATGTRNATAVAGAIAFRGFGDAERFRELLETIDAGQIEGLAFAVPTSPCWPLPLYELALFTAEHVKKAGDTTKLTMVSPESRPLEIFGDHASDTVASLLEQGGIEFIANRAPERFSRGRLTARGGRRLRFDAVVSVARPLPPTLPGVPRDPATGFIPTGSFGQVLGVEGIYAAGDATNFPIKQGGLAAQEADAAASAIAERAGAKAAAHQFRPVLRAALFTPWGPRYLRCGADGDSVAASSILWWPPAKVGGKLLGPYLAKRSGHDEIASSSLKDTDPPPMDDPTHIDPGHEDAFAMALASAQAEADEGEYVRAVRWLTVAEDLELRLPATFEAKREAWRAIAEGRSAVTEESSERHG